MVKSEIIQPYIKHDDNASQDGKILKLCLDFKKLSKTMTREELESFVAHGAYALFWRILEFMHNNKLFVDDVEILADNLRIDSSFLNKILNDFELFHISNGEYISERLLKDIKYQKEKKEKTSKAAETKWLMSDFKKYYVEIFGKTPCLESEDIEALKEYSEKIEDFRDVLPDILFTMSKIKFDEKAKNYTPLTNWLLSKHNLSSVYEGAFSNGKLRSWKAEKERRKQEQQAQISEENTEEEIIFSSKAEALEYISTNTNEKFRLMNPIVKNLMKQFDITEKEVREYKSA